MVMRGHPVRAARGRAALRRRQPQAVVGEGQEGAVPHPALCAARLSEPAQGDDRGGPGKEAQGQNSQLLYHIVSILYLFYTVL